MAAVELDSGAPHRPSAPSSTAFTSAMCVFVNTHHSFTAQVFCDRHHSHYPGWSFGTAGDGTFALGCPEPLGCGTAGKGHLAVTARDLSIAQLSRRDRPSRSGLRRLSKDMLSTSDIEAAATGSHPEGVRRRGFQGDADTLRELGFGTVSDTEHNFAGLRL
ncbi:hypothetical protein WOLCODRAFT_156036 [Wolfiporia cocos MD-104 SS10]|uniref:Uncharacterized protein n=1 Tax=Wolfiporia cocos (strain MD-104) TaxID=742152 RepID=A0A2H3IZC1_WOLCO|nr:hypothetical protein WOLCODRAFT_156036 [Wolfiporia cocos MD-104 SS10]